MATVYCWVCRTCGAQTHSNTNETPPEHNCPDGTPAVKRDYAAENVGIGEGVRESRRELSNSGYRDLFLPTAEDYMGPDDIDGQKGLRKWADEHGPREDNKRPMWPEMTKTQF
jgi:hypothetical protein